MKEFLKDRKNRELIWILSISGIIISTFVALIINFTSVKSAIAKLFSVLSPFIWGILFAIIANKPAVYIENKLPTKMSFKTRRFIGALLSTLILILVVVLVIVVLSPKLITSIASLSKTITDFITKPNEAIQRMQNNFHLASAVATSIYEFTSGMIDSLWKFIQEFIPDILNVTFSTVSSLFNFIIGFIVCLYILIDKQRIAITIKKISLALLDEKTYVKGRSIMYLAVQKFSSFFSGKILDSFIIGVICFIAMMFINSEYAVLIAVVVGVTNIIPFFGPFIGAIPCALILLIVKPIDALIFVIFIIILQQIDGNIIGPKILGDSVGLSSLWIMFSIVVGGAYFGFFGMLLGVPVFSVFYYIVKEYVDEKYKAKTNA